MAVITDVALGELLGVSTMTLATVGSSGEPHAAMVYFVAPIHMDVNFPSISMYYFSNQNSQHSYDLQEIPQAAATIYPLCRDWQDIRGLQLRGRVRCVPRDAEWDVAWRFYALKFPFAKDLKTIVAQNEMYVFEPGWVRLIDNRRGFGFKQEWFIGDR